METSEEEGVKPAHLLEKKPHTCSIHRTYGTYDAPDPSVEVDPYDVLSLFVRESSELELEMNERGNK